MLKLPILLIVTTRPEYDLPGLEAAGQGRVTRLLLQRLEPQQGLAVVRQRAEGRALPLAVVEQIVAKADGIPLFLEELTKNVLISERRQADTGTGRTAVGISAMDVPETLYDALMARLDQMSTVKQVAQLSAVVGRGFTLALLEAVSDLAPEALHEAVDRLVEAEVFYPLARGAAHQEAYAFKHALLQEVAYQSLMRSARQRHHARIARALEERFRDLRGTARNWSRITSLRRAMPPRRSATGLPRAGTPRSAQPISKPPRSCVTASRCWTRCPTRRSGRARNTRCGWP